MTVRPKPQEIYRHFKGNLYQIITLAKHTETGEQLVIYQALYGDFGIYARPLSMFTSRVDRVKYPDVQQEFRFELQGDDEKNRQQEMPQRTVVQETEEVEEAVETQEIAIDPMLLAFLDTDSYDQKLNILAGLQHRITDDMITTMAIACDVEVPEGTTQKRYESLRNCLLMFQKYEGTRNV